MDRELPPVGDERELISEVQKNDQASSTGEVALRLIRGYKTDREKDPGSDFTDFYISYATETKALFIKRCGTPSEIPDLRVADDQAEKFQRSGWAASIVLQLDPDVRISPSVCRMLEERLDGRFPFVTLDESFLIVDFQLEDGTRTTRLEAEKYGFTLATLFGGLPAIYTFEYADDDDHHPNLHKSNRSRLRPVE